MLEKPKLTNNLVFSFLMSSPGSEEAAKSFDPLALVYPGEVPLFDKYDEFLPEALVKKGLRVMTSP